MRILFFAHLKEITRCAETQWDASSLDADELWQRLGAAYPGLERFRTSVRLARNGEYAPTGTRFHNDDEVALIPPVSGG